MSRVFHPLFYLFACATRQMLARYVHFLKAENELYRSKFSGRITLTAAERQRLVRAGRGLGKDVRELVTIVKPATFMRWVNGGSKKRPLGKRKPGRPRTPDDVRELILRLARENRWGYTRILGEIRKLGIRRISRQTVKNILKAHGLEPGPIRGEGSWDEFLKIHAATLWQCDFLSKRAFTKKGPVDLYLLIGIHVGSRRVLISAPTAHPDSAWVAQQARNFTMVAQELSDKPPDILLHDHDTKFTAQFDEILKSSGVRVKEPPPCSPNLNAFAERFIQTLEVECLDHFIVLGERHLHHLAQQFVAHYHAERPHQSLGNRPPNATEAAEEIGMPPPAGEVICHERLGGLLKHYERAAA